MLVKICTIALFFSNVLNSLTCDTHNYSTYHFLGNAWNTKIKAHDLVFSALGSRKGEKLHESKNHLLLSKFISLSNLFYLRLSL